MQHQLLICLTLFLSPVFLNAQPIRQKNTVQIVSSKYTVRHWTTKEGLPNNYSSYLHQSLEGYIWVSTETGLARFDGNRFDTYFHESIPNWTTSWVNEIRELPDSTMWLVSKNSELVRYANNRFTVDDFFGSQQIVRVIDSGQSILVQTEESKYQAFTGSDIRRSHFDGVDTGEVHDWIVLPDSQQWLGSPKGLFHYDGQQVIHYDKGDGLPSNHVLNIEIDNSGELWLSSTGGIGVWRDGKFKMVLEQDSTSIKSTETGNFIVQANETWLIGNRILHRMDKDSLVAVRFGGKDESEVKKIFQTRDGRIWVRAGNDLVGKLYYLENDTWYHVPLNEDVKLVTHFEEDREGNLWLATTAGLFCLSKRWAEVYTRQEGLPENEIYPLLEDQQGVIWVGTWGGGLLRLDGEKMDVFTERDGLYSNFIRALGLTSSGDIIAGSSGGITRIMHTELEIPFFESVELKSEGAFVRFIYGTEQGGALLGGNSVYQLLGDSLVVLSHSLNGLVEKEDIWFATENTEGLVYLATHNGLVFEDGDGWKRVTTEEGLPTNKLTHLYFDNVGDLWISTYDGGVVRIRDDLLIIYNEAMGLHSNAVHAVIEDNNGYMWFSHNNGISKVSKVDLNQVFEQKKSAFHSESFTELDGLPTSNMSRAQPSLIKAKDGKLWFPSSKGFFVFDPEKMPINKVSPTTVINNVIVNGEPLQDRDDNHFSASSRNLVFQFTALSFTGVEKNKFKYFLEGNDDSWSTASTIRDARYTNLASGEYVFLCIWK